MRNPKKYTLSQFIDNMNSRKNMNRYDKVELDFMEYKQVPTSTDENLLFYYKHKDNKTYTIYIYKLKETYICGVMFAGYEYDFGEIKWPLDETQVVTCVLDCDIKFQ